jgi:hypothetical protein
MIKRPASLFRFARRERLGAIAQLGERVLCKHEVVGSIPTGSTSRTATATMLRATMLRASSSMKTEFEFAASRVEMPACCLTS